MIPIVTRFYFQYSHRYLPFAYIRLDHIPSMDTPRGLDSATDVERASSITSTAARKEESPTALEKVSPAEGTYSRKPWLLRILAVEARGIVPTSPDERTDPQFWKVFFIWLSANCNILSYVDNCPLNTGHANLL